MAKKKYTQQEVEKVLNAMGVTGLICIKGLGTFMFANKREDRLKIIDAARTEMLYEDRQRELLVESWFQGKNLIKNKQSYIG